jgi:hypothetical protein
VLRTKNNRCSCQDRLVQKAPELRGIACNQALKDNMFMMMVSVALKIPLFLVGKPGSSKSLAKTIIHNVLSDKRNSDTVFQNVPQVSLKNTEIW